MFFKKIYKLGTVLAFLGVLTSHAASDIDLEAIKSFSFTSLPAELQSQRDTLLLSDSPEYVGPVGGVLSAGSISGKGRIYFYHVNEMEQPHKIAIVLENVSDGPNEISVFRELKSIVSDDYFAVGRDLSRKELEQPLTNEALYSFVMPTKSRRLVFLDLENSPVQKDALFTGIVDLQTSRTVFARVMMIPTNLNSVNASYWSKNLPIDHVRLRGTFNGATRMMAIAKEYDTTLGGAYVELGNDREDRFIEGVDEMDNNAYVKDSGNYGVSYTVKIPTTGEDPFRLYFNPLGGAYSGSFIIKSQHRWQKVPRQIMTYHVGGEDGLMALGHNTIMDSRYMGSYYGGDTLTIEFMPAGASNLPFRFLLVPEALANPQYTKIATINKAELQTLQAAAKREAAEAAKKVDKEEKKVAERMRAEERAHQQAEKAKLAVEKAKTLKKIEEARQLAEKRYHEYEIAQTQTKEARRRADMQREVQQKAEEHVEEIRLAVERYTNVKHNEEREHQKIK